MLIEFSGSDRVGNLFCLGGKHAEQNVQIMESAIQTENFNELFDNNLRYTSCNVTSIGKFGSLEFRSMRGTVDQNLIQLWVDILLMIKDNALSYENPREIVKEFLRIGPEEFLRNAFSSRPDIYQIFRQRGDRQNCMWDGLRLMRDVAYAVRWEKFDPELDKKKEPTRNGPSPAGGSNYTLIMDNVVMFINPLTDRIYIKNYNHGPNNTNVPTLMGRSIVMGPREVYEIRSDGRFLREDRHLEEDESVDDNF